jgi:hypothetical protein
MGRDDAWRLRLGPLVDHALVDVLALNQTFSMDNNLRLMQILRQLAEDAAAVSQECACDVSSSPRSSS